jgi:hypothetical protein
MLVLQESGIGFKKFQQSKIWVRKLGRPTQVTTAPTKSLVCVDFGPVCQNLNCIVRQSDKIRHRKFDSANEGISKLQKKIELKHLGSNLLRRIFAKCALIQFEMVRHWRIIGWRWISQNL